MSVNLDGYNIPRKSTLKSDLEKRIDKLEESVVQLLTALEMVSKTIDKGEENADKRKLR